MNLSRLRHDLGPVVVAGADVLIGLDDLSLERRGINMQPCGGDVRSQVLRARPRGSSGTLWFSQPGRSDPELMVVQTLISTSVRRWIFAFEYQRR